MEIVWENGYTPEKMLEEVATKYVRAIQKSIVAIAQARAPEIADYMRANHPWQNQTGEAESKLGVRVEEIETELVELLLEHGAFHGWYLEGINPATMREMMRGGQYAILAPTVDAFGPVLMADIRRLVEG